ncbi:MAG: cytochrome c biogenesis CcdA family protein [Thermomicrobiales bacterium]
MVLSIRIQNSSLLVGVILAFVGGLLSFGSPCCLPLVPGYLGHLAGISVEPGAATTRRGIIGHGIAFVLGFATVFTVVGIAVGQVLTDIQVLQGYVRWIGGVVIIIMGLHTTGLVEIPILNRTIKMHPTLSELNAGDGQVGIVANRGASPRRQQSLGGRPAHSRSFLVGVFFAAGWSPCVGPILTGIYGVAGTQPGSAGVLFFAYSLGLGLPFLLVALFFGHIRHGLWHLNRYYNVVACISGAFLIFIGILLLTDTFARLARYAPVINLPGVS